MALHVLLYDATVFVAGWRHALRSEWSMMMMIHKSHILRLETAHNNGRLRCVVLELVKRLGSSHHF